MDRLIEDYLRTRGVRYFRGHHDDEYFFLVDFLVDACRGRLNVHLEVAGSARDAVSVGISPDRYYPATERGRLVDLAARWSAGGALEAVVHDSCDPQLVGLLVRGACRPDGLAELTDFTDGAVGSAVELFGRTLALAAPRGNGPGGLRDAG